MTYALHREEAETDWVIGESGETEALPKFSINFKTVAKPTREQWLSPADMLAHQVCERFGITVAELKSDNRRKDLVMARAIVSKILRERDPLKYSFSALGRAFNRDHTSIMHQVDMFPTYLARSNHARMVYEELQGGVQ